MYLYQLGTDQVEKLFSVIRTITHARNCDSLELCQRLSHAECVELILEKNPTWKRMRSRRLGGQRDASSQREWTGDLDVGKCDIVSAWKLGELEAIKLLNLPHDFFLNLSGSGVTMMRPNKRLVGVNVDTERIEVTPGPGNEVITQTEEDDVAENLASLDIEEAITEESAVPSTSITVDVGGKQIHKSSVIREMFESSKASNDRLRRVRGYSKIVELTEDVTGGNEVDLDDCIMLGDTLAAKIKNSGFSFILFTLKSNPSKIM